jgi:outer membrane protein assembly factor BamD
VLASLSACNLLPEKSEESRNWPVAKLYAEAREEMSAGHYENAVKLFERLETNYPFGTYAAQAQMEIAYAYYKMQDQAQALAAVERFIKLHPNHVAVDYMYYLRGLITFNDQMSFAGAIFKQDVTERDPKATRDSFVAFKELVDKYPDSTYAPDAIARMKYLINAMAQYEVHVANYYYRRGAYVASLNRAMQAVRDYQDAPAREEALYLMVTNYDKMGMFDLRDDAQRVLKLNYPNSRFLRGGQVVPDAPWWKFWSKAPALEQPPKQ